MAEETKKKPQEVFGIAIGFVADRQEIIAAINRMWFLTWTGLLATTGLVIASRVTGVKTYGAYGTLILIATLFATAQAKLEFMRKGEYLRKEGEAWENYPRKGTSASVLNQIALLGIFILLGYLSGRSIPSPSLINAIAFLAYAGGFMAWIYPNVVLR